MVESVRRGGSHEGSVRVVPVEDADDRGVGLLVAI